MTANAFAVILGLIWAAVFIVWWRAGETVDAAHAVIDFEQHTDDALALFDFDLWDLECGWRVQP